MNSVPHETNLGNCVQCMRCGRCSASCPAASEMDLVPHRWVDAANDGDFAALETCSGIWKCTGCFCCAARCPRGVQPAVIGDVVRTAVSRRRAPEIFVASSQSDAYSDVPNAALLPQQLLVATLRKKR